MILNLDATVHTDRLQYSSYPVPYPSRAALTGVTAAHIELIFRGLIEFQILLRSGEVLLFPLEKELALREFARRHQIPVVGGSDPWPLLCEPFLDTEFTSADEQLTSARLNELGFEATEIKAIRKRVESALNVYVFRTWEWQLLGLLEVLTTYDGGSEDFYRWVFAICRRGYQHATPLDLFAPLTADECRMRLEGDVEGLGACAEFRSASATAARASVKRTWWLPLFRAKARRAEIEAAVDARMVQRRKLQDVSKWLLQHYSEPNRRYHNVQHVIQVMSLLKSLQPDATTAAMIAGLFHDAIYSSSGDSNEMRSAAAMREQLDALGLPSALLDRAAELILYTQKHEPSDDPEEQTLHDIDLGIFGQSRDVYAAYAAGIREEYASVPDLLFRSGRAAILRGYLERARRGRFFYRLDPIFEPQVASNLEWELSELAGTPK